LGILRPMEDEKTLKQIGEKLKQLRIKAGYKSHEIFAFEKDISRSFYWKIEAGKSNVTMKTLIKLLNIHNVSLEEFFRGM
jgi:transcriptional regulator with XRE-family HTH domain